MLELVIAGSMMAMVMTSLSIVLRTGRVAWEANDNDYGALHHAHAVATHFIRQARETRGVVMIDSDGKSITLQNRDNSTVTWALSGGDSDIGHQVVVSTSSGSASPLAHSISDLSFTGYRADGVTVETDVDDIRLVMISVSVDLPRGHGSRQTVFSKVWIRSW
tara:strand:- start:232997 stop:233485 length:489 start_codon:yes stop_codon:yes gene_type:complete